jgi:hypothetical protein
MANAALRAETATVRRMTDVCDSIVDDEGGRFRIRGRYGQKFPLEGKGNVKTFASKDGVPLVRGAVRGIPEGFWVIVQEGSYRHVITSRKNRQGQGRTTRKGRQVDRFMTFGQVTRSIQKGASLNKLRPVRTPYGPRQYVIHPGHGQIGNPWRKSMDRSADRLPQVLEAETVKRLAEKFRGVKR